jgi:flagellar biogenesis protein FliO
MDGFSTIGALLKVVAVFVLFWFTLRGLGRLHGSGGGRGRASGATRPVEVVGRSPLGRKSSIVVVRLGTAHVALGVTEGNVTLLGPVDVDQPDAPPAGTQVAAPGPSWREVVSRLQERTVRH